LDFETSTDDPKTGFACSIGIALFEGDKPVATFGEILKPPVDKEGGLLRAYDPEALAIGGFDLETLLRVGTPLAASIWRLHSWASEHDARDLLITAYNAPFDFAFYSLCLRFGYANIHSVWTRPKPPLRGAWLDTRLLAMDSLDEVKSLTLSSVAAELGFQPQGAKHDATEDAILNGRVYHKLQQWAGY
jgi:DNA polymerase III epsilon subunit-like protein